MAGQNNGKQGGQQQDVNQLLKVRREKLANLQEAGQDPFQITKYDVTHHTACEMQPLLLSLHPVPAASLHLPR